MKVAIASTDGKQVNEHFGKAERFSIFELGEKATHIEDRICEKLSTGDLKHAFDPSKFNIIADTIKDCKKVYVSDIGKIPEAELKARGLEVVRCNCPIDQISTCGGKCKPS